MLPMEDVEVSVENEVEESSAETTQSQYTLRTL